MDLAHTEWVCCLDKCTLWTTMNVICQCEAESLVLLVVVDSEDFDWLAWLYPSPYTAAQRFDIVMMAPDGVFMRVYVNYNFFFWVWGGNICFSKYPTMYKRGLRELWVCRGGVHAVWIKYGLI